MLSGFFGVAMAAHYLKHRYISSCDLDSVQSFYALIRQTLLVLGIQKLDTCIKNGHTKARYIYKEIVFC